MNDIELKPCHKPETCCIAMYQVEENLRNCPNNDCYFWDHKLCRDYIGEIAYLFHKHRSVD